MDGNFHLFRPTTEGLPEPRLWISEKPKIIYHIYPRNSHHVKNPDRLGCISPWFIQSNKMNKHKHNYIYPSRLARLPHYLPPNFIRKIISTLPLLNPQDRPTNPLAAGQCAATVGNTWLTLQVDIMKCMVTARVPTWNALQWLSLVGQTMASRIVINML